MLVLPSEFVIRESCGCRSADRLGRIRGNGGAAKKGRVKAAAGALSEDALVAEILEETGRDLPSLKKKLPPKGRVAELVRLHEKSLTDDSSHDFHEKFIALCSGLLKSHEEISSILRFIAVFFGSILQRAKDMVAREKALASWNEVTTIAAIGSRTISDNQSTPTPSPRPEAGASRPELTLRGRRLGGAAKSADISYPRALPITGLPITGLPITGITCEAA